MRDSNLEGADLIKADLDNADLGNADLSGTDLRQANLYEANLYGAYATTNDFLGAEFCNTTMPDGSINNQDCK